jgi:hypothetical protein
MGIQVVGFDSSPPLLLVHPVGIGLSILSLSLSLSLSLYAFVVTQQRTLVLQERKYISLSLPCFQF